MQAAVRRWGPVVAWAAVIFAFSSIPSLGTGLGTWDLVLRKIAHATEFAILAALLVRALRSAGWAIAIGIAYAVSDEIHQSFVSGRQALRGMWASTRSESWSVPPRVEAVRDDPSGRWVDFGPWTPKDVGDRQLDALLERLDRLTAEVHGLNRRLDSGENLAPVVRELAMLNESLQTLAYAALGQSGPQVQRRRRAG